MPSPALAAFKATTGQTLNKEERECLTPALLAILAADGTITLSQCEREKLSPELRAIVDATISKVI